MDVIHPRCAGLDISKKDAKVCVRINGAGRRKTSETVTTFGATTVRSCRYGIILPHSGLRAW